MQQARQVTASLILDGTDDDRGEHGLKVGRAGRRARARVSNERGEKPPQRAALGHCLLERLSSERLASGLSPRDRPSVVDPMLVARAASAASRGCERETRRSSRRALARFLHAGRATRGVGRARRGRWRRPATRLAVIQPPQNSDPPALAGTETVPLEPHRWPALPRCRTTRVGGCLLAPQDRHGKAGVLTASSASRQRSTARRIAAGRRLLGRALRGARSSPVQFPHASSGTRRRTPDRRSKARGSMRCSPPACAR
jgi:hypothetical protein